MGSHVGNLSSLKQTITFNRTVGFDLDGDGKMDRSDLDLEGSDDLKVARVRVAAAGELISKLMLLVGPIEKGGQV